MAIGGIGAALRNMLATPVSPQAPSQPVQAGGGTPSMLGDMLSLSATAQAYSNSADPQQAAPQSLPASYQPAYDNTPTYPTPPAYPSYPTQPAYSNYPSYPNYPSQPINPNYPSYPSYPTQPGYSNYPSYPNYPNYPGYSNFPSWPNWGGGSGWGNNEWYLPGMQVSFPSGMNVFMPSP